MNSLANDIEDPDRTEFIRQWSKPPKQNANTYTFNYMIYNKIYKFEQRTCTCKNLTDS
jgi:hypothetical protein